MFSGAQPLLLVRGVVKRNPFHIWIDNRIEKTYILCMAQKNSGDKNAGSEVGTSQFARYPFSTSTCLANGVKFEFDRRMTTMKCFVRSREVCNGSALITSLNLPSSTISGLQQLSWSSNVSSPSLNRCNQVRHWLLVKIPSPEATQSERCDSDADFPALKSCNSPARKTYFLSTMFKTGNKTPTKIF
jgi:hypothetical protein